MRNISNETRDESYEDEGGTFTDHDDSSQEQNVGYTRFPLEQVCLPFICHTRLIGAQDGHIPLVTKMKENSKMEI